jgi:hypothetical protein
VLCGSLCAHFARARVVCAFRGIDFLMSRERLAVLVVSPALQVMFYRLGLRDARDLRATSVEYRLN